MQSATAGCTLLSHGLERLLRGQRKGKGGNDASIEAVESARGVRDSGGLPGRRRRTRSGRGRYPCRGGSIAAGTYKSLTVTGFCAVDSGSVTVLHDVTVTSTGGLDGTWAGSTLTVGHDLVVQQGGSAVLGCDPEQAPCNPAPSPPDVNPATVTDTINGNVRSTGAMYLVIHDDVIGGNVSVSGGTASYDCSAFAFTDFALDSIGGNVRITGLRTCWDGLGHDSIGGNVIFDNNITLIVEPPPVGPDGNLLGDNIIGGNLSCSGNSPTPHLSDAIPTPNTVAGKTRGQCVGEV